MHHHPFHLHRLHSIEIEVKETQKVIEGSDM